MLKALPFKDDIPCLLMMISDDSDLKGISDCFITVILGKTRIEIHPVLSIR